MECKIVDNSDEIEAMLGTAIHKAMEEVGIKVEKYAKALCPVGTPESTGKAGYRGGTLRRSITHQVYGDDQGNAILVVGSNVVYAPYVELGTGPYFTPPPEWETFKSKKGSGVGHGYVHARPFLRPAIVDHISLYNKIIKNNLTS